MTRGPAWTKRPIALTQKQVALLKFIGFPLLMFLGCNGFVSVMNEMTLTSYIVISGFVFYPVHKVGALGFIWSITQLKCLTNRHRAGSLSQNFSLEPAVGIAMKLIIYISIFILYASFRACWRTLTALISSLATEASTRHTARSLFIYRYVKQIHRVTIKVGEGAVQFLDNILYYQEFKYNYNYYNVNFDIIPGPLILSCPPWLHLKVKTLWPWSVLSWPNLCHHPAWIHDLSTWSACYQEVLRSPVQSNQTRPEWSAWHSMLDFHQSNDCGQKGWQFHLSPKPPNFTPKLQKKNTPPGGGGWGGVSFLQFYEFLGVKIHGDFFNMNTPYPGRPYRYRTAEGLPQIGID